MVFHLSEHFLENSEKFMDESGCFFLCSSRQVCTAYEDILPLGLLGSPLAMVTDGIYLVVGFPQRPTQQQAPAQTLPSLGSGVNWCYISSLYILFYFLNIFFSLFLETGEGKERERERNINVWLPLTWPVLGTWPATQACALTGNRTSDPLVCGVTPSPLSYTGHGCPFFFLF